MKLLTKVALAGMFGTAAEDFDFLLASYAAALVWGTIFFPSTSSSASYLASITAFVVSFVGRPLGSFIFGHLGDTRGRKSILVLTLILMGVSGFLIALIPGYATIGIFGGIFLLILRFIQGLGYGGEWGNATTWVVEEANKTGKRGFWAGLVPQGYVIGGGGAALGVTLMSLVNFHFFLLYGWRIMYIIGAVAVSIGAIVRYRLVESGIFDEIIKENKVMKLPALMVLRERAGRVFKLAGVNMAAQTPVYVGISALIIYLVEVIHISPDLTTTATLIGTAFGALLIYLTTVVADRIGRRATLLIVYGALAIYSIPFIYIINTGIVSYVLAADSILIAFAFAGIGPMAAFLSENFDTKYRASGSGMAYQFGVLLGVLPQTYLITYILGFGKTYSIYIAVTLFITVVISLISTVFSHDTEKEDLSKNIA